jgi:hypothetical protein
VRNNPRPPKSTSPESQKSTSQENQENQENQESTNPENQESTKKERPLPVQEVAEAEVDPEPVEKRDANTLENNKEEFTSLNMWMNTQFMLEI